MVVGTLGTLHWVLLLMPPVAGTRGNGRKAQGEHWVVYQVQLVHQIAWRMNREVALMMVIVLNTPPVKRLALWRSGTFWRTAGAPRLLP